MCWCVCFTGKGQEMEEREIRPVFNGGDKDREGWSISGGGGDSKRIEGGC